RSDSFVVKEKEKEKEREKIRKKEKESGMKFPSYYSASPPPATAPPYGNRDKRHSPLSPLIGFASSSHHHQSPTIGKALGVRTSLLGFGTESPLGRWDTSSPAGANRGNVGDATEMFDKPRKAPLPPGHTPSPSTTSASGVFGDEEKTESHSRKPSSEAGGGYLPGGPSTLGPVREESEGQMGTSQEGSGDDGRQAEREEDRLSPAPQRQYVVVTPPPPQDDGIQEAIIVPLPPSASSHHTESSRQPSPTSTFPSPISPISPGQLPPPIHGKARTNYYHTRTPNEGSGSTSQKPPIPPKSADTIRLAQGANTNTLKSYSSTPNLLAAAFGTATAADVNTSPSKGKGKERVHVDEALNTHRSPSSAAAGATTTASRVLQPHLLQAQTICDAFMFPKPRFVAHVISPPGTPDFPVHSRPPPPPPSSDPSSSSRPAYLLPEILPAAPLSLDKVLKEGEMRERERDQWAAKASKGLLSRNLSTRSRAHTDASGGSQRGRNLSVASGSTGSGFVNRLRARTLSGRKAQGKGHKRGGSKETEQTSEMGEYEGGARIGGRSGTLRGLKKEGSYEFDTLRQRQMAHTRESPTPASMTTATTSHKPVPLGKQGKLSISLNEKDQHQATVTARGMTDSGGTVRSTHTTSNTTHSRKSSGQSRHGPFSSHPFASHSRSGSSGSVSNGAASAASYAIRKVKSLCGPERLSPAAEETS
ncbi:hypothetical protein FRC00_012724, partial [Tulasnella sp. 408]